MRSNFKTAYIKAQERNGKLFQKKKNKVQFRMIMTQGSTVQQFWPECNVYVFVGKLVDSIYRGPGNKWEILFTGLNG